MKYLRCPDCDFPVVTKSEKLRVSFLGGRANCADCKAQLVADTGSSSVIVGAVLGSVFIFVVIYTKEMGSWLPVLASFFAAWCLIAVNSFLSESKRIGTKNFHI